MTDRRVENFALKQITQLENDKLSVSYIKIEVQEKTGTDYHLFPHLIIALKSGP